MTAWARGPGSSHGRASCGDRAQNGIHSIPDRYRLTQAPRHTRVELDTAHRSWPQLGQTPPGRLHAVVHVTANPGAASIVDGRQAGAKWLRLPQSAAIVHDYVFGDVPSIGNPEASASASRAPTGERSNSRSFWR